MLLQETAPAEMTRLMGCLSSALIDVPALLDAIREGNEGTIKAMVEAELSNALIQYCKEKLTE
jgi:mannitol operon transcriptional antiterminator